MHLPSAQPLKRLTTPEPGFDVGLAVHTGKCRVVGGTGEILKAYLCRRSIGQQGRKRLACARTMQVNGLGEALKS